MSPSKCILISHKSNSQSRTYKHVCMCVCVCVCVPLLQTTDHISTKHQAATELMLQLNNLTQRKREKCSLSVNCPNTL